MWRTVVPLRSDGVKVNENEVGQKCTIHIVKVKGGEGRLFAMRTSTCA